MPKPSNIATTNNNSAAKEEASVAQLQSGVLTLGSTATIEQIIALLKEYEAKCRVRSILHVHKHGAIFYNRLNRLFSLPLIIITGVAGALGILFATPKNLDPIINIVTCVLVSIQTVFKFAVKADQHESAARFLNELAEEINLAVSLRKDCTCEYAKEVSVKFINIVKQSPSIDEISVNKQLTKQLQKMHLSDSTVVNIPGSSNNSDSSEHFNAKDMTHDVAATPITPKFPPKLEQDGYEAGLDNDEEPSLGQAPLGTVKKTLGADTETIKVITTSATDKASPADMITSTPGSNAMLQNFSRITAAAPKLGNAQKGKISNQNDPFSDSSRTSKASPQPKNSKR